jgi:hypothetical protein
MVARPAVRCDLPSRGKKMLLRALLKVFGLDRFLATGPRISREGGKLVATTGIMSTILTLGLHRKRVEIDAKSRTVRIGRRIFWFFPLAGKEIPFDRVERIVYRYRDANPFTSMGWTGDAIDRFDVGLRVGRDEVPLFAFTGEGSFQNGSWCPDWYYWDEFAFDLRGGQEQESKAFVNLLEKMLGRPIGPS